MERGFELQGHRGARGLFPENTLEGFTASLAFGLDSIELDVAVTADGVAVVVHDPVLNPSLTRGTDGAWLSAAGPAIHSLTLSQVQAYDVGRARPGSDVARAHPDQAPHDGARIPTLAAVFAALQESGVRIDVELKTDPDRPDLTVSPEEMADIVVACAAGAGALSRLAVRSFDWRGLRHMQRRHPAVALAWLTGNGQGPETPSRVAAEAARSSGIATWAPQHAILEAAQLRDAQARGLRVVPWTVNAPDDMARLIAWGVDGLCTDRPDLARAAMRAAGIGPGIDLDRPS